MIKINDFIQKLKKDSGLEIICTQSDDNCNSMINYVNFWTMDRNTDNSLKKFNYDYLQQLKIEFSLISNKESNFFSIHTISIHNSYFVSLNKNTYSNPFFASIIINLGKK